MTQRSPGETEMLSLSRCALGQTQNIQTEYFRLTRSGMRYVTTYSITEYPVQPLGQLNRQYEQYGVRLTGSHDFEVWITVATTIGGR